VENLVLFEGNEVKVKTDESVRKVFLDELPRHGNTNRISWKECKDCYFNFQWDNIIGTIKIIDVKTENKYTKLLLQYKDNKKWITPSHISECKIAMLIGIKTYEYSYNVNDTIKDDKRNIEILEQIKIIKSSGRRERGYKYKCLIDGNIDNISEFNLKHGQGCNVCSNNKVLKGINDVYTTDFWMIKYFKNEEDAHKYSRNSHSKIDTICPDCKIKKQTIVKNLCIYGFSCPKCGDGISMPNKIAFNMLEQLLGFDNFEREYSPKWIDRRLYDFYFKLNKKEYIIEMDGRFHNIDNNMNGNTKEESKVVDDYKDEMAELHGIEVIRINCDYENNDRFEHVKNNILKNEKLNELFDLSIIDWTKVYKYIFTNKMKESCDLFNSGRYNAKEIGKILKLSSTTITKYLKNGTKLNLCNYNGKDSTIKSTSKKVKCIEYNLIFNSLSECAREVSKLVNIKLSKIGISRVCLGYQKTHNNLHFEFIQS